MIYFSNFVFGFFFEKEALSCILVLCYFKAVGAGMEHIKELDIDVYKASELYCDHLEGTKNEFAALEKVGIEFKHEIGDIINDKITSRNTSDRITIFQSIGKYFFFFLVELDRKILFLTFFSSSFINLLILSFTSLYWQERIGLQFLFNVAFTLKYVLKKKGNIR